MALAIDNLVIKRAGKRVLDIPGLEFPDRQITVVIGPNGSGKTTLLMALSRLIIPESGVIRLDGLPITAITEVVYRRKYALVMQDPLLFNLSVFNNVALGLRFRGLRRQEVKVRVEEWLERLGLSHLRHRPASQISGGEAQRVSLARAFVLRPEMLFLDEPFSALDAPSRASLLLDFQSILSETQTTTIFVTHDQNEALMLAHRLVVLLDGQVRQVGLPQEVFSTPVDEDVAAFVGVETVISGRVIECKNGMVLVSAAGFRLEAVGELVVNKLVLYCLRPEDVTLWSTSTAPTSSARNHLTGRIIRMVNQGPLVHVTMDCGFLIRALITRASAFEMALTEGQPVTATFKASAAHLIPR